MKRTTRLMVLGLWVAVVCAPMFARGEASAESANIRSVRLNELNSKYLRDNDVEGFWQEIQKLSDAGLYPFVEDLGDPGDAPDHYVRVTFLHKASAEDLDNVFLFASINHVLASELLFEEIGQTGVYFKSVEVPPGIRFQYRIIENDPLTGLFAGARYGTRMHLLGGDPDPFCTNRKLYPDGLGEGKDYIAVWAELPGASAQPYIVDAGNETGELKTETRISELTGHSHDIYTYLPPGYNTDIEYPLLILFDAGSYFSMGQMQLTLENLIADGSIPPLLVLGIDAGKKDGQSQRNDEFTCSPKFMEYLAEELLPWFTSTYNVTSDPKQRVIAGSSFGGLFSTYFSFNHPELVANVLSQSGSYHWGRDEDAIGYEWLVREFAFAERKPIKIFMEVGVLEGEYSWMYSEFPHQLVSHRHFKTILDMKGYEVEYLEYGGGHEMLSWQGGIADGLKHLFK